MDIINNDFSIEPPSYDAPHILIVDDDERIKKLLKKYLLRQNNRITVASNTIDARNLLRGLRYDLILLDVMMPGENGIAFAKALREDNCDTPILMLSAISEKDGFIEGLEAGADDYMSKPFDPRELQLRISNWVRRTSIDDLTKVEQVVFGDFTFALTNRELKKSGQPIRLTEREREILHCVAKIPGDAVSREELTQNHANVGERTIDVQINHLRRKIERDPSNPHFLQTVRGKGYRLVVH